MGARNRNSQNTDIAGMGGGSAPCPCLFNIFTLKNDLRTFVEKCRESHLRDIMGQIAQDAWIRGWGGGGGSQPNLGNACILGVSGPVTPPLL